MERYIEQLLDDIAYATENISLPFVEKELDLSDWLTDKEEEKTALVRNLEDWTNIKQIQLPPPEMLTDDQIHRLLDALIKMLNAYNWSFVLQIEVPERIQYATIRDNFNQEAKIKHWHYGFFKLCSPDTKHGECSLGEYCQCRFYADFFSKFDDKELSPEEERAIELECRINHIKKKHGRYWRKYYPYHLDPEYDDEDGNPFDYGFGEFDDDDDDDTWWR